MKSEKLKGLLRQKLSHHSTTDQVTILNREELQHAIGGAAAKCPSCPALTSCGSYCSDNCGIKLTADL